MNRHNSIPSSAEMLKSPEEAFMSLEQMQALIQGTLLSAKRIDENNMVLPVEVQRCAYDPAKWIKGPRLEPVQRNAMLVPTESDVKGNVVTESDGTRTHERIRKIDAHVYDVLRDRKSIDLQGSSLFKFRRDIQAFNETLAQSDAYTVSHSVNQLNDAFHISRSQPAAQDIAMTRIYVPAGVDGPAITKRMVELGADFSYAKVWLPQAAPGHQMFRKDCPIFEVQNYGQLSSVLGALRTMRDSGNLANYGKPLVGLPVADLPGIYVGQTISGKSFNGRMEELFATPMIKACREANVPTGTTLSEEWFASVSKRVRDLAMASASEKGVNSNCHALLATEDEQKLLAALTV